MKLYSEHGDGHPLLVITGLGNAIWSWQMATLRYPALVAKLVLEALLRDGLELPTQAECWRGEEFLT